MGWEIKFIAVVALMAVGVILVSIFGLMDDFAYIPTVSGENISAYKSSCTEIDLNQPEDNLGELSGQKVKVKGKLIESFDGTSDRTFFTLKVANLTYYPYVDFSYSAKIPYKEGDELEVYGECGDFSIYDNITVPFIKAAYIEKV